jgi:glycosyltransferase 2 family protein
MKTILNVFHKTWRPVLTLLAFYPLVRIIISDWIDIRIVLSNIRWELLLLSLFLLFLVLPLMASISWVSLRFLDIALPSKKVISIYFLSQLTKYLPGGIWAFPGRMIAYQAVGVEQSRSIASVFREVSALVLASITVSLLVVFQDIPLSKQMQFALIVGLVASILAILITQMSWFWRLLKALRIRKIALLTMSDGENNNNLTSLKWLPGAFFAGLIFWLAMGIPFQQLCRAISPESYTLSWVGTAAVFALAWTVGFVVFITPAGLGVRESVLSLLLSTFLPVSQAVSIALLSRLAWMVIEAIWILISIWLNRDQKQILPANP